MTRPDLLLRSLLIQGSWNYRNLLGTGVAWALSGARENPASHGEPPGIEPTFNAHPYLITVALGALARASQDKVDLERVRRFRDAIPSALGSLGDNLVWAAWRPFCLVSALLAGFLGGPAGIVVMGLLIVYNAAHCALRAWGLSVGLEKGLEVAGALRSARLPAKAERIAAAGVLVTGVFAGVLFNRAALLPGAAPAWIGGGVALLAAGFVWGEVFRRAAPVLLLVVVLGGFVGPAIFAASFDG